MPQISQHKLFSRESYLVQTSQLDSEQKCSDGIEQFKTTAECLNFQLWAMSRDSHSDSIH